MMRRAGRVPSAVAGLLMTLSLSGCAGAPGLDPALSGPVTGSIATKAPSAAPTGLAALNPLPVLGQLASNLGNVALQPVAPPDASTSAPHGKRSAVGLQTDERTVTGKPIELFEQIGRNVHACFMGGRGPLKGSHLFQGETQPESKGGRAEITIHEKDKTQSFPRGLMVFKIAIEPAAGTTAKVEIASLRLPADLADAMRADVLAWLGGKNDACQAQVVRPPAPQPQPVALTKTKKKPAIKSAIRPAKVDVPLPSAKGG